jgi:sugar phosphate isomerase/epimerase
VVTTDFTRRQFLATASVTAAANPLLADRAQTTSTNTRRIGVLANGLHYSIGLFQYKDRPGQKLNALQFVETTHRSGGNVAKLHPSMITSLSDAELKHVRAKAEELDVAMEIHGGNPLQPSFETTFKPALALGAKLVGGAFGFFMRPGRITSLTAWDAHVKRCRVRLKEVAVVAKPLGITIGIENHLDFTTRELRDLIISVKTDNVGVVFDVGNSLGTLDDPIEAVQLLGPHVVSTHFKDYAVEETELGFRLTPVPLGIGSLRLEDITRALKKHIRPDVNFAVGTLIGSHLDVNWLEDRFWTAYRDKSPHDIAAALHHFRSKPYNQKECIRVEEYDKLSIQDRTALELDRMKQSVARLRTIAAQVQ